MELLRKSEIKRRYGISYTTLQVWEENGLITAQYGCLFDTEEVEKAMNRQRKKSGAEKRVAGKWKMGE